jgi:glycosyltransferase involved in cell wall biosynthesis
VIAKHKILLMGGIDMDLRLDLMNRLKSDFEMLCAGTTAAHEPKFSSAGFRYYSYPLGRTISPLKDLWAIMYLRRLLLKIRPDILHTFDAKPGVWGRIIARWVGVPVIIGTLPGLGSVYTKEDWATRLIRVLYEPLQRIASNFSDTVTFQNHEDALQLTDAGVVKKEKTLIIPGSGVPTEVYAPGQVSESMRSNLRKELGIRSNDMVVTMISRVIRTKGVMEFMEAAAEIKPQCSNVHFLLIGPNDQQSVDRLNASEIDRLRQFVNWPGPRRDIPTVLGISDVFVFPSAFREGIPRVLLEAASMGLPIITTDSPGCNEVVEDGSNGFLVPVRDPRALSRAILRLIDQPQLRQQFGAMSRKRAVERFDLAIITEQIRSMYQQLLAKHHLA